MAAIATGIAAGAAATAHQPSARLHQQNLTGDQACAEVGARLGQLSGQPVQLVAVGKIE